MESPQRLNTEEMLLTFLDPLFTEEKRGIYPCICDKHFKTKAGLSMHQAWCREVVPTAKDQNANKITATNFSKTRSVNEDVIT